MYLVDDHRSWTGNVILKQPGLTWNDSSISSKTANFGNVMECWDLTKMGFIQPFYKLIQAVKQQHYVTMFTIVHQQWESFSLHSLQKKISDSRPQKNRWRNAPQNSGSVLQDDHSVSPAALMISWLTPLFIELHLTNSVTVLNLKNTIWLKTNHSWKMLGM